MKGHCFGALIISKRNRNKQRLVENEAFVAMVTEKMDPIGHFHLLGRYVSEING